MENMKIEFAFAYTQKIENTIEGGKKVESLYMNLFVLIGENISKHTHAIVP